MRYAILVKYITVSGESSSSSFPKFTLIDLRSDTFDPLVSVIALLIWCTVLIVAQTPPNADIYSTTLCSHCPFLTTTRVSDVECKSLQLVEISKNR